MTQTEKDLLRFYVGVEEESMDACAEAGFTIGKSFIKAQLMQYLNLSLEGILQMIETYDDSETEAAMQAYVFLFYKNKDMIRKGIPPVATAFDSFDEFLIVKLAWDYHIKAEILSQYAVSHDISAAQLLETIQAYQWEHKMFFG